MADTNEALKIWQALQPMIDKEIAEQTESCVRAKKMIVKRATQENENGKGVNIGVMEPYGDKVIIPSGTQLSNVNPGEPVWVYWYLNNASTMHVALTGDGSQGTADTDRLAEMLEKEIADREAAMDGLKDQITQENEKIYSYIDKTSSRLRLEFTDELNGLRSYLEMTASHLRIEFQDDLNSMRSYLEMTASHLRIAFEDGLNSMRSYLELTASHLRLEFYNDMDSLRSYLEMTASHLRVEFADDVNSLRSYLELTASALRLAFENDVESLRSYLELTASHLRLEFDNDMESLRSYLEMTASQLRIAFDDDINSLRSYVDIQAGKIEMNVAATDENSSILRQAGMYINDQGVLVYATDNQNNIGSKLNVLSNEISAKVGRSEVVITDDSITIGSQSISLAGYVKASELEAELLRGYDIDAGSLVANSVNSTYGSFDNITTDAISVNGESVANALKTLGPATSSGGQITIPYTTLGGGSGSVNFNIADTQYYIDGVAAARTAGYTQGQRDWRPDNIRISGKNVIVLNAASDDIGGPYSAASIYDDGAASVTLSGTWSGRNFTVTASNGETSSSGVISLPVTAASATLTGTTVRLTANILAGGSSIGSDWTQYDISSELSSATTLSASEWSSWQSTVTAKCNGTEIGSLTVDATSVYNAGWNACRDAATNIDVVRNSEAIYNGTMYIKQATEYVAMGTGQWRLGGFTATAYILPQPK